MEHTPVEPGAESLTGERALTDFLLDSYGKKPDGQFASAIGAALTGASVDHVVYYAQEDGVAHWDFISFGMSEIGEKLNGNPEVSGSGYEFTLRTLRNGDEAEPHAWPMRLFTRVGDYALSGAELTEYDYLELESLDADQENQFVGALLVPDPKLEKAATPNGEIRFMQIVPILEAELETVKKLSESVNDEASSKAYEAEVQKMLASMRSPGTELVITNLSRTS